MTELRDRLFIRDKDPEYYYRWCNQRDLNMLTRVDQGFEVVKGANEELPPELRDLQSTQNPGGGSVRQRSTDSQPIQLKHGGE